MRAAENKATRVTDCDIAVADAFDFRKIRPVAQGGPAPFTTENSCTNCDFRVMIPPLFQFQSSDVSDVNHNQWQAADVV